MTTSLKIFLILVLCFQLFSMLKKTREKKLTMKYASFWIVLVVVMILLVIFPNIIYETSKFIGFEKPSNMVLVIGMLFLLYVSFVITITISIQNEKIKKLVQEISLLKEENNEKRKKE